MPSGMSRGDDTFALNVLERGEPAANVYAENKWYDYFTTERSLVRPLGTVTLHLARTHSPQYKLLLQYGIDATN